MGELDAESDEVRVAVFYDAISGEDLGEDLAIAGRRFEVKTFKKHGVCEKRPLKECWEKTGKWTMVVKWVHQQ